MQLLIQISAPDYATWKRDFDGDAEGRATAGLTVLQIWTSEAGDILVLLTVAQRARAQEWLANQAALGQAYHAQFLKTAL